MHHAILVCMMPRSRFTNLFFTLPVLTAMLGLGLAACGDDTGGTTPEAKYTLDNVCEKLPAMLCAAHEPCCTQGAGYDEAACTTFEVGQCEKNVADVAAGVMTFNGDSIDACIAALAPYSQKCFLDLTDYLDVPVDLAPCSKVFAGTLGEGATCDRNAQCGSSIEMKEISTCDEGTLKCSVTRIVGSGAKCDVNTDPKLIKAVCDEGLYCDFDILTQSGNCAAASPLGAACNPSPINLSCGLGAYCDSTTKVCTESKAEGAACGGALECKSIKCEASLCVRSDPLFSGEECTGAP
jgi:hypothetical protein